MNELKDLGAAGASVTAAEPPLQGSAIGPYYGIPAPDGYQSMRKYAKAHGLSYFGLYRRLNLCQLQVPVIKLRGRYYIPADTPAEQFRR